MAKRIKLEDGHDLKLSLNSFLIDASQLNELFESDNIKDGISNTRLLELKGVKGLVEILKSDVKEGLSSNNNLDLQERAASFGRNNPIIKPRKSLWKMILEAFEDLMLRIIAAAAIVSTIVGVLKDGIEQGWIEGATIIIALVIIVLVTAGNNYLKEKQFEKLYRKTEERTVEVIRDGKHQQLNIFELLVGDIMNIQIGEILPVDGVFVSGSELLIDESAITGESDMCRKKLPDKIIDDKEKVTPFLLSGSKCMDGNAQMIVCAVGVNSQNGKLKLQLQGDTPPTPLQVKLESVASDIGKAGVVCAALTVAALFIHYFIKLTQYETCFICYGTLQFLISALLQGVIIIVVAVPEGLPLAVTISLAYCVNKMKDENNLVRQLQSCEIMGGANSICSDKTGTLTQNKMSVTDMYFEEAEVTSDLYSSRNFNKENVSILCEWFAQKMTQDFPYICLNSTANPEKKPDGTWEQIGNKTECALLELADSLGTHFATLRPTDKVMRVIPFSSSRKKMTTIYRKSQSQYRIYIKGASENVLEKCTSYLTNSGPKKLSKMMSDKIMTDVIISFANQSLRTIGIAYKEVSSDPSSWNEDEIESDLTLIGVTGIKDPLRPEINDAIKKCKKAGIIVRMVTGDNITTAISISKECGILPKDFEVKEGSYEALEGKKFRELVGGVVMDDSTKEEKVRNLQKFKEVVSRLKVLARSSPEDKYTLATGLIQLGEVVAVTGDGTNDAPALKKADVGFAMGIAGTEVAKEAAGIILLDDNFSSIVTACKWGRNIYDSIRKFIQFQLTINMVALFMAFIGAVVISASPLNSIQMLWINLIQDTFAALALATEPPSEDVLDRMPYSRREYIVTPMMWRNIIGQSLYQNIVFTIMLFLGPQIFGVPDSSKMVEWNANEAVHFTLIFHAFVFAQVFNQINCRKLLRTVNIFKNFCNNSLFFIVEIGTLIVQFIIVELGGNFTKCSSLTLAQHLYCIAIGAGSIIVGYIIRALPNNLFLNISFLRDKELENEPERI